MPHSACLQNLLTLNIINQQQIPLFEACVQQPQAIIKTLLEQRLIDSHQLSQKFARYFEIPLLDSQQLKLKQLPDNLIDPAFIQQHYMLPLYQQDQQLITAVLDPSNQAAIAELQFYTGLSISMVQAEFYSLERLIKKLLSQHTERHLQNSLNKLDSNTVKTQPLLDNAKQRSQPIVQYIDELFCEAGKKRASDIHIEPNEKGYQIRFRIDGLLYKTAYQSHNIAQRLISRIKVMAAMDIAEQRLPQDGRIHYRLNTLERMNSPERIESPKSRNHKLDFRVSSLPTIHGEKIVLRLFNKEHKQDRLKQLGFSQQQLTQYRQIIQQTSGMILFTGPTGSGKTQSLYASLNKLNNTQYNIATIEDPVEMNLAGINQLNINPKLKLGFASALRAMLRQDPDILMVGEIRDKETAEIAVKAAQTGHQIFSTLHTNNAAASITRLLNIGIPVFNLVSALRLIVAQRLIRTLCKHCKIATKAEPALFQQFKASQYKLSPQQTLYKANADGCEHCTQGYQGRTGVFELMPVDSQIQQLILDHANEQQLKQALREKQYEDLLDSALQKVSQGISSVAEIERVII